MRVAAAMSMTSRAADLDLSHPQYFKKAIWLGAPKPPDADRGVTAEVLWGRGRILEDSQPLISTQYYCMINGGKILLANDGTLTLQRLFHGGSHASPFTDISIKRVYAIAICFTPTPNGLGQPGCAPNERARFRQWVEDGGLVDAYRMKHPHKHADLEGPYYTWRGGEGKYFGKVWSVRVSWHCRLLKLVVLPRHG
jgi:hypothetical protein